MTSSQSNSGRSSDSPGPRGPVLAAVALVIGLLLLSLGFMAGRASMTATADRAASGVVAVITSTPTPDSASDAIAGGAADLNDAVDSAAAASPTLEPTTPTPLPTATPPPTPEIALTIAPTAEPTAPATTEPGTSPIDDADLSTLYEAWQLIAEQYDGSLPVSSEVVESIIAGSLDTLDDEYTRYAPPDIARRMREDMEGSVEGIGAFVRENEDGMFEIVRPIDGQPADLAGLKPGDVLLAVDGESVTKLSFDEVILLVRGPQGTSVTLTIQREGEPEPLEFTIVRTRFEVPVVESEMLPLEMTNGTPIAYIRLTEFNRAAEEKLLESLQTLLAEQPAALVFDLRDNPGGFLDQSVAVADAFLGEGVVLFERNIRGLDETFRSDDGDLAETIPMVVLVNAGSASASEIVAGAIQDRGRALLVGETTFGKGSVQQINTLSDGSELRITAARWYTPNNHTIDGAGITPDIEVETPEDLGGPDDAQLMRAIELLLTGQ